MALILTVERDRWRDHLAATVAAFPGLVPVVKGNGYGFGRTLLADLVGSWATAPDGARIEELAVGTVHELAGLAPDGPRPLVLTPAIGRELAPSVGPSILTVASRRHVEELVASGLRPPVVIKLVSAVRRYGVEPPELPELLRAVEGGGLPVHGFAVHPPLAGSSAEHAAEVVGWLARLPAGAAVYVSHLDAASYRALAEAHPGYRWHIRLGTALWHGDRSSLRLEADVLQVRAVEAGQRAGYRLVQVPAHGHLVLVTAGSAHGIGPLPDGGLSPFHFSRRRLALLEPPHMHTSMLFVPDGDPLPEVGDRVDVQHPLTRTLVDRIVER